MSCPVSREERWLNNLDCTPRQPQNPAKCWYLVPFPPARALIVPKHGPRDLHSYLEQASPAVVQDLHQGGPRGERGDALTCRRIVQQRRRGHGPREDRPGSDRILRDVKLLPPRRQSGGGSPAEVRHPVRVRAQLRWGLRGHGRQRDPLFQEEGRPLPHARRGRGEAERPVGRSLACPSPSVSPSVLPSDWAPVSSGWR